MKVLIASDGSTSALHAADAYCRLSASTPHELTVITVDEVQPFGFLNDEMRRQRAALQKAQAQECFAATESVLRSYGRSAEHVERTGQAGNEIVSWVETQRIDLTVVGSKGEGLLSRLLLGSTSDAVVAHINSSVLVVPPGPDKVPNPDDCHVVVAWDGSVQSKAAVQFLKTWALVPTCRITVVSFLPRPRDLPEEIEYDHKQIELQSQEMESACVELRECYAQVDLRVVESHHAASAIIGFAEANNSSLIVVGDKGRSAIERILIGSVTRYVLHHSVSSVLVVKTPRSSS
jgi:nucleotide-binding universal stress UspA family protein